MLILARRRVTWRRTRMLKYELVMERRSAEEIPIVVRFAETRERHVIDIESVDLAG